MKRKGAGGEWCLGVEGGGRPRFIACHYYCAASTGIDSIFIHATKTVRTPATSGASQQASGDLAHILCDSRKRGWCEGIIVVSLTKQSRLRSAKHTYYHHA